MGVVVGGVLIDGGPLKVGVRVRVGRKYMVELGLVRGDGGGSRGLRRYHSIF